MTSPHLRFHLITDIIKSLKMTLHILSIIPAFVGYTHLGKIAENLTTAVWFTRCHKHARIL